MLATLAGLDCQVGICHTDKDGRFVQVDQIYSKLLDIPADDLLGSYWIDTIDRLDQERVVPAKTQSRSCAVQIKYRHPHSSGQIRIFCETILPSHHDQYDVGHVTDLTPMLDLSPLSIDRFLYQWHSRPKKEFAYYVGYALGRIGHANLNDFYLAFGASFFSSHQICQRIDFLYNQAGKADKMVNVYHEHSVLCIKDLTGKHDGCRVMAIRGFDEKSNVHYSIRPFIDHDADMNRLLETRWNSDLRPTFENVLQCKNVPCPNNVLRDKCGDLYPYDNAFWSFRKEDSLSSAEGVIVYPGPGAFTDVDATMSVCRLIVLASNILGFH